MQPTKQPPSLVENLCKADHNQVSLYCTTKQKGTITNVMLVMKQTHEHTVATNYISAVLHLYILPNCSIMSLVLGQSAVSSCIVSPATPWLATG